MGLKNIFSKISGFSYLMYIRTIRQFKPGLRFTAEDKEYESYLIDKYTYGTPLVLDYGKQANLKIGKFCSMAGDVKIILGGEHNLTSATTYPLKTLFKTTDSIVSATKGDVIIGNDVWIGYGATILSGVNIGDGAVIGARAVVAKSVEPYSIVVGNPAKEIRKRFDDKTIKKLLKIRWWDWHIDKINANQDLIIGDINKFLRKTK